jgi:aspartate dehydrogenase
MLTTDKGGCMKSNTPRKKIGIIGFGQIGSSLYHHIQEDPDRLFEVAFIYEINPEAAGRIPANLRLNNFPDFERLSPDLVVEAAHPAAVRQFGSGVLRKTNLMIMSVSSLHDKELEDSLLDACRKNGTTLFIPHGATLGLDGLRDGLSIWEEVTITMRKNPVNISFDKAPHLKPDSKKPVVIYDGATRGILPLFPKNVNSHATLAIATLGLDRTRSILISDPNISESIIEIAAKGSGTSIEISRRNPIKGVTGKLTLLSAFESIKNILKTKDLVKIC